MSNAQAAASAAHDYLAIIRMGVGSCFGRSPNKEEAIDNAVRSLKDWSHLFKVADVEVTINVVDVQGYGTVDWGDYPDHWLHGKNEATGADEPIRRDVEKVKRRTPKWKTRR